MILKKLHIRHFQGIQNIEIGFNSSTANIYGDNGTGKTTLFNAYSWLLTGKNSLDKKDFGIKRWNKDCQEVHNEDATVEAEFDLPEIKLKKVYREKWTKVKGSTIKEFTGNTTDFFVNDFEVKESEYKSKISEIISEEQFKLLSNPLYSNTSMKWEDLRTLLFKLCDDVTDNDIFENDKTLSALVPLLGGNTVSQYKQVTESKLKEIDKTIQDIPVKISELQKSIQDTGNLELEDMTHALETLKISKDLKLKEKAEVSADTSMIKLKIQLDKIENNIQKFTNDFNRTQAESIKTKYENYQTASMVYQKRILELDKSTDFTEKLQKEIIEIDTLRNEKLTDYKQLDNSEFKLEISTICPVCESPLSESKKTASLLNAREEFNAIKESGLAKIKNIGMQYKTNLEETKTKHRLQMISKIALENEVADLKAKVESLKSKDEETTKLESQEDYKALLTLKEGFVKEIEKDKDVPDSYTKISEIDKIIAVFDQNHTEITTNIAKFESNKKIAARIEQLEKEEKESAIQYANWFKQKTLCEAFTTAKIKMSEEKINSKFKHVKFKLFETLVNGAIKECCVSVYEGVPFADLNNAMKINAGIDAIKTFSEHFKINVPLWIDNRESIVKLTEIDTQIINLFVSEEDKELRW